MLPYKTKGERGTPKDESNRMIKKILTMENVSDFSIGTNEKIGFRFFTGPDLPLKGDKSPLQVSFSSMDQDNDSLLHFLLNKAKS